MPGFDHACDICTRASPADSDDLRIVTDRDHARIRSHYRDLDSDLKSDPEQTPEDGCDGLSPARSAKFVSE